MVHLKMKKIGTYQNREVHWVNYPELLSSELPNSDWICMLTASQTQPDINQLDHFVRKTIANNLLEFKGHGKFGEFLHDLFDETMVEMETMENHPEIEAMTTCHNNETLADVFWQCFFATCLPEYTNYENIKIICSDLDGINRANELKHYIKRFEEGWLPNERPENWTPIEFDEILNLIKQGISKMTLEQQELWNQISMNPIKWIEQDYGKEGNGFWVVACTKNKVVWFNDIEDGFNISNYSIKGKIDEYGAEQDELQWTIQKLKKRHHNKW